MNRCVAILVLAVLPFGLAPPADAVTPEGPQLAISVSTDGPGAEDERSEVITAGPLGEDPQRLVGGRGGWIGETLSWSADGNRLAFVVSGVKSIAEGAPVVGVADVDGGPARVFPRAFLNFAGEPVMAPDGRSVVFQRVKAVKTPPGRDSPFLKSSIWVLELEDVTVRRLTRWRFGSFLSPISYTPDGSAVVALLFDRRGSRIVAMDLRSHRTRPLAALPRNAQELTYSPDGTSLAFVRVKYLPPLLPPARPVSELVVARANGSDARRLLRRRGYISSPSWDPSGNRIAFTRDPPAKFIGLLIPEPGNKVMAINADGTCLTRVFTDPAITGYGVAWRPGIGREAGPISC